MGFLLGLIPHGIQDFPAPVGMHSTRLHDTDFLFLICTFIIICCKDSIIHFIYVNYIGLDNYPQQSDDLVIER